MYHFFASCRIAELVSHQFSEQGLYHYVYNMADLSQLRGCVVVQPKPTEHVIKIMDGQFMPGKLGTIHAACGRSKTQVTGHCFTNTGTT